MTYASSMEDSSPLGQVGSEEAGIGALAPELGAPTGGGARASSAGALEAATINPPAEAGEAGSSSSRHLYTFSGF